MTTVTIGQGTLQGAEKLGCLQFRNIPYATADRWAPPGPPATWDGTRDATAFGPICPQSEGTLERLGGASAAPPPQDEDCLSLNVWTPETGDARLPVMVWIHGGGYSTGSGRVPWYAGHNFARDGVVLVTINYRLNAFGYLSLDELFGVSGTSTLGTQDQIAALRWVQDNIAAFGGDPGNVTIFGESAGGWSVSTLLASPPATGLFHKAIPQSGAGHTAHTPASAASIARWMCRKLGVEPGDVDALRAVSAASIVEAVASFGQSFAGDVAELFGEDFAGVAVPFQPLPDGAVLPQRPIDAIQAGSAAGIPVLIGTNHDEWRLWTGLRPEGQTYTTRAPRPMRNACAQAGRDADEIIDAYEAAVGGDEVDVRVAVETDRVFRIPATRIAEAQVAQGAPVWMYRFDWPTPLLDGKLRACHALEIPFVFDNLDAPGIDLFTGGAAPQELATRMHATWVAFARTGTADWPAYDTDRRSTMVFDDTCKVVDDPQAELRELWDGIL